MFMSKLIYIPIILLAGILMLFSQQFNSEDNKPYSLCVYYALFDTPEHFILEKWICQIWQEYLPMESDRTLHIEFVADGERAESLLQARKLSDLNREWLAQQPELVVAFIASLADGKAQLRVYDARTQRFSPLVNILFDTPQQMAKYVAEQMLFLLGLEATILNPEQTKNIWQVRFRGSAIDLQKLQILQTGTCFWVFHQRRRLADSILFLKNTYTDGANLEGLLEYKGSQVVAPGMQAIQIYFTGGEQKFRLVNQNDKPQAGFSIFASYEDFNMESSSYRGTTDSTGEFTISDPEKKPIFLVIGKNVENINFAFFRKLLVIQSDIPDIQTIVISDAEVAAQEAQEITPQKILQRKQQEIQRTIAMRLEQAKEYIQKQELPSALKAIQLAQQNLEGLPDDQRAPLGKTLKEVEEIYHTTLIQRQAKENYLAACKLLEEADALIDKFEYTEAQTRIQRAQELWPMQFYEQEFIDHVQTRNTRLQELIKEVDLPIGQARVYIIQNGLTLTWEKADPETLNKLYTQLKILYTQGMMNPSKQYNDVELWHKMRIMLNDLSQQLMKKSQEYLALYQKATSVQQRSDLLEKHQKFHQCSRTIDDWLQEMK